MKIRSSTSTPNLEKFHLLLAAAMHARQAEHEHVDPVALTNPDIESRTGRMLQRRGCTDDETESYGPIKVTI